MLYNSLVEKSIRQSFDDVNHHRWDVVLKGVVPNVHHRLPGTHALAGERHDKATLRRWFERFGRVLPNLHLTVTNVWVTGWPWQTTVFAQWDGTHAAQRRRVVLQPWAPRVHPAVGQSICDR